MAVANTQGSNNDDMKVHGQQQQEQEILLPGFRFHPTDEELVGYYLRRKVTQRPLAVEVITQLDIYKFDPWDLPKMSVTKGEKEWYFFCPRDRKYRNSARPNRVTGAGFWKATGTDRNIYSSDATKCIGLKKSLVFYKGRAAKGIKTDWMMHEFRLPASSDAFSLTKIHCEETTLQQDAWAVCRIFKKSTMAQRHAPASQHWAITQHEKMVAEAAARSFALQMESNGDLEVDTSSPERSESTGSEEQELEGPVMQAQDLPYGFQQREFSGASHVQQQWPLNFQGELAVDSTARNNIPRQRANNPSEMLPLEMVNAFFAQESPSARGALDFVNFIGSGSSPRSGPQFVNSNGSNLDMKGDLTDVDQLQQGQEHGQTMENICNTIGGGRMSTPMMEKFRRELFLQIPQGPAVMPYCAMQPWEMLSPIFDISTSSNQLECM